MPELTIVSRKLNELRVSLQPNVETLTDATALRCGGSRARLQNTSETVLRMPRPCAV